MRWMKRQHMAQALINLQRANADKEGAPITADFNELLQAGDKSNDLLFQRYAEAIERWDPRGWMAS